MFLAGLLMGLVVAWLIMSRVVIVNYLKREYEIAEWQRKHQDGRH